MWIPEINRAEGARWQVKHGSRRACHANEAPPLANQFPTSPYGSREVAQESTHRPVSCASRRKVTSRKVLAAGGGGIPGLLCHWSNPMPLPEEPPSSSLPHGLVLPWDPGAPQVSWGNHVVFFSGTPGALPGLCQLEAELQRLQNCSHFIFSFRLVQGSENEWA